MSDEIQHINPEGLREIRHFLKSSSHKEVAEQFILADKTP